MHAPMHGTRHSVLIVFPDDWAPFSPTLIRLVTLLSHRFDVKALAFDTGRFDLGVLDQNYYVRVRLNHFISRIIRAAGLLRIVRTILLTFQVRKYATRNTQIIAVDADGATASWLAGRRMHYLSLEVARPSLATWVVPRLADSIVIQSQERLTYQFDAEDIGRLPIFFVQNSPDAPDFLPVPRHFDPDRPKLVYMGNLIPSHGLLCMLDLLRIWQEATLTLQGITNATISRLIRDSYGDLLESGRLVIESRYLNDDEILGFLAGFDIGLCLYESPPRQRMDFNYESSPAGKMFNYFAAGLPVLASRHIGLQPVSAFSAGIQAPDNLAPTLLEAGRGLCRDYGRYRLGAIRAAQSFDFSRAAGLFVDFLGSKFAER